MSLQQTSEREGWELPQQLAFQVQTSTAAGEPALWQVDVLVWNCSFYGAQLMFVLTLSEKQVPEGKENGCF